MRILYAFWTFAFMSPAAAQLSFASELPPCAVRSSDHSILNSLTSSQLTCVFQSLPAVECPPTNLECMCQSETLWRQADECIGQTCTTREALGQSSHALTRCARDHTDFDMAVAQRIANQACGTPPRDRSLSISILCPSLAATSGLFVLMRICARRVSGPEPAFGLGWDDFVLVAAWSLGIPIAVMDPFFRKAGLGRDVWTASFEDIDNLLQLFYIAEIFYLLTTSLTKIALLAFFLRVFPTKTSRRITWGMIAIVIAFIVSYFFLLIFQCWPINYAWLRWDAEHEGTCINVFAAFVSHAAINMALDIVILIMPLPQLYRLHLTYTLGRKMQILGMFSVGCIVTIFSIVRLDSLLVFEGTDNPTFEHWGVAVWSVVEVYVGIVCACLPATKVFVLRLHAAITNSVPTRDAARLGSERSIRAAFDLEEAACSAEQPDHGRQSPARAWFLEMPNDATPTALPALPPPPEKPMRHIARVSLKSAFGV